MGTGEVGAQQEVEGLGQVRIRSVLGLHLAQLGEVAVDDSLDDPAEEIGAGAEVVVERGAVEAHAAGHPRRRGGGEALLQHDLFAGIQDLGASYGSKTLAAHGGAPGRKFHAEWRFSETQQNLSTPRGKKTHTRDIGPGGVSSRPRRRGELRVGL